MQLDEILAYKNQIVKDLLTTPEIYELIDEKVSEDNPQLLAYTHVFPYQFVPDTVENGSVFVCIEIDIDKTYSSTTLSPVIYVWVFAHKSLLRLDNGGLRVDALCSEITKKLNGSTEYGMGELEFQSLRRYAPMTDYQGKILTFRAKEWNRTYKPKNNLPDNRKYANKV